MGNIGDREGAGKGRKRKLEGLDPPNVSRSASKTPRNSLLPALRMCTSLTAAGGSEKFLANDTHIDNEQRGRPHKRWRFGLTEKFSALSVYTIVAEL